LFVVSSDGKRKRDEKSREKHCQRIAKQLTELAAKAAQSPRTASKLRQKVQSILRQYDEGAFYDITWEGPAEAPTAFRSHLVPEREKHARVMEGIYVVATTLPREGNPIDAVFTQLKQQWRVEDSHRVLKGPLRISPVFLHIPKRIEGLVFVLWLALVTFQLLEREWRSKVQDKKAADWTTQVLLRVFEGYSYVGVQVDAAIRWVPCVVPPLHRMIYQTLDLLLPNTS